ncbi:MAG: shikimate kinase [Candidatus Endobugula sp.]
MQANVHKDMIRVMIDTTPPKPLAENRMNIILIGMPGSGKSTVGVQLAKTLGLDFIDTDIMIQTQEGRQLQDIQDNDGHVALRAIEEHVILGLDTQGALISTGGSAIYSDTAMQHLTSLGIIVFLEVSVDELEKRINGQGPRGIACSEGQTFFDIYTERTPLYRRYADITYNNETTINITDLVDLIQAQNDGSTKRV